MKIGVVSDMHGLIPDTSKWPELDLFIDCGDFAPTGWRPDQFEQMNWVYNTYVPYIDGIRAKNKIIIGGNHDGCSELKDFQQLMNDLPRTSWGHERLFEIEGKKIYATCWNYLPPEFATLGWCWGTTEEKLAHAYDLIPEKLDLLITHCPPKNILDAGWGGYNILNCGSVALRNRIERISADYHVFGHEHFNGGNQITIKSSKRSNLNVSKTFINAAQHFMEFEI